MDDRVASVEGALEAGRVAKVEAHALDVEAGEPDRVAGIVHRPAHRDAVAEPEVLAEARPDEPRCSGDEDALEVHCGAGSRSVSRTHGSGSGAREA